MYTEITFLKYLHNKHATLICLMVSSHIVGWVIPPVYSMFPNYCTKHALLMHLTRELMPPKPIYTKKFTEPLIWAERSVWGGTVLQTFYRPKFSTNLKTSFVILKICSKITLPTRFSKNLGRGKNGGCSETFCLATETWLLRFINVFLNGMDNVSVNGMISNRTAWLYKYRPWLDRLQMQTTYI